ncbi:hypothetical protein [Anaerosolibacter sp.]|uniref:hypothetical protein n=1 Tax=Anaerosolibacter sp. TaxID=1872527 RepID=UPI0039EEA384
MFNNSIRVDHNYLKVFLHLKDTPSDSWSNIECNWEILPGKGDLLTLSTTGSPYKVIAVLYPIFQESEYDVEVYAVKIDLDQELSLS